MFFSERKLREMSNIPQSISIDEIVFAINSIGFEVEEVVQLNKNSGLKFGHVLDVKKNPNSDKLTICEVEFNDKKRTIQTAASNVKKGDYLIAFVPGSKLNEVTIQAKKMGKIISEGMLASLSELGFSPDLLTNELKEGIFIIDKVDLNKDPIEFFGLNDNIIEVSILSNRSDAQSYEIFSQELAAYFHTKLSKKVIKKAEGFNSKISMKQESNIKLNGVEVEESNFVLSNEDLLLLLKSNIKIDENKYTNFSNLSMIMNGISLRCFDSSKIKSKLSIKNDKKLTYIFDGENKISLLGVCEEENFKAKNNSKNILFEFSQIDEKIVRDNSKLSKKITNSSINNSRVISEGLIKTTMVFIQSYFKKHSKLINPLEEKQTKIKFDREYVKKYAGFDITKENKYKNAIKSLEILNFKIDNYVSVPNTRHDVKNMQNIVEEIFRFYGLNNFNPENIPVNSTIVEPFNSIEKTVSNLGYTQAWTYTLVNKEKNYFNPFKFKEQFNLLTFVSEEFNSIRNSIAIPLFNVFDYNKKRKIEKCSFFDLGMINNKKSLMIASNKKTYVEIKSDIEKITNQKFEIRRMNDELLHPNYNAALFLGGEMVGWIGKFNPFFIDSDVIFAEVLLDVIYKPNNKFVEYDTNPLKERDITIEINNDIENALYLNLFKSIEGLFSIELISTYKLDKIKKLTYRLLMNEKALEKFESIDWNNKQKIMDFN